MATMILMMMATMGKTLEQLKNNTHQRGYSSGSHNISPDEAFNCQEELEVVSGFRI